MVVRRLGARFSYRLEPASICSRDHETALMPEPNELPIALIPVLRPGEELAVAAQATEATIAVTDQRVLVDVRGRLRLNVEIRDLRRIEFDLDRTGPATVVIVPDDPRQEPQVLAIPFREVPRVVPSSRGPERPLRSAALNGVQPRLAVRAHSVTPPLRLPVPAL